MSVMLSGYCKDSLKRFTMTTIPLSHPDRTDTGFRPLKAWRHFRKLIADKHDAEADKALADQVIAGI